MFRYKAEVIKITDGDTLDVIVDLGFSVFTKVKLRLDGINTPESRTRDLREKRLGLEAKRFTKEFLKSGECEVKTNKKGKFGRWLAEVFVDDKSLNKELIKANLAREYHGEKRSKWFA